MLSLHKKKEKTVEGLRIDVHFSVHTHKKILKEYPTSVVEKYESLVDWGKGWED